MSNALYILTIASFLLLCKKIISIFTLFKEFLSIVSQTNGLSLSDTIDLLLEEDGLSPDDQIQILEFRDLLQAFLINKVSIETLFNHSIGRVLFEFFKNFPISFAEKHIHLSGSLAPEFVWPRLKVLLEGVNGDAVLAKIREVYGKDVLIDSVESVQKLIELDDEGDFAKYLRILFLPKIVLNSYQAHREAAYFMAKDMYDKYNVASLTLKFTLSRSTKIKGEQVPGLENLTPDDVVLGLYDGYIDYQKENPKFRFTLSPSFRKELDFFDADLFDSKKIAFEAQVLYLVDFLKRHPHLKNVLCEVDTVGDEKSLYRKSHFEQMRTGFRKLQYLGFQVKSHHGETWKVLRKGIQAVDNAMNIWHIDTLEHGLSLGVNPNYYYHRILQEVISENMHGRPLEQGINLLEIEDMHGVPPQVLDKLKKGELLDDLQKQKLIKIKFHHAREMEHYQHDVLNRMINKKVGLVALPSSNLKLTGSLADHKDHPFSWWEKKGVKLGIGTDNYITLKTNFIQEMMILLFSEPNDLKITKLLMVATQEKNRAVISNALWQMRKAHIK